MAIKTIQVEGLGLVVIARKRGVRSMRLHVDNQGGIRLTLPWWVSARTGMDFVHAKSDWIQSQKSTVSFIPYDGMAIGKGLRLAVQNSAAQRPSKRLDGNSLLIRLPAGTDISDDSAQAFAAKAIIWALRIQSEELLLPRIRKLASQHGFVYKSCSIKQLKARWGSCSQYHDIVLNLYLIQLPWELIDYVLLHELNHTSHLYHGPVFWRSLEEVCPQAKTLRKKLHAYQPRLYQELET